MPTVALPTPTPTPTDPLTSTLDTIDAHTAVLRSLYPLRSMDRNFITRDELFERLRVDLDKERDDIYQEQELYLTLGILDRDADLYQLMLAIFGEDILGFYDTKKEKLFVVRDEPDFLPNDALTYAHEFVHGLQQHYFDIYSLKKGLEDQADRSRALRALIEGDATLSESFYMFVHMDEDEREAVFEHSRNADTGAFDSAPHVIQRAIAFPYSSGARFVYSLFLKENDWNTVNQAFEDLPQSTEQILHPEKYFAGEQPKTVELPDLAGALGEGWTELDRNTLGEFLIQAYLETTGPPERASLAATGWGGDTYALLKGPDDQDLLVSKITWDREVDAQEFFEAFLAFTEERISGTWESVDEDGMERVMGLPDQSIYIDMSGLDTLLIFAPDMDTLEVARVAVKGM